MSSLSCCKNFLYFPPKHFEYLFRHYKQLNDLKQIVNKTAVLPLFILVCLFKIVLNVALAIILSSTYFYLNLWEFFSDSFRQQHTNGGAVKNVFKKNLFLVSPILRTVVYISMIYIIILPLDCFSSWQILSINLFQDVFSEHHLHLVWGGGSEKNSFITFEGSN